jgi:hypothetical protein
MKTKSKVSNKESFSTWHLQFQFSPPTPRVSFIAWDVAAYLPKRWLRSRAAWITRHERQRLVPPL